MKILLLSFAFSTALTVGLYGQNETTVTISDKIKMERDSELNSYKNKLKENDVEIKKLQDKLSESNNNQVKIATLDGLQQKLDERIKALETASKRKANYNGQLALIELLSVQRDLQPAQLFSSSQTFFSQLGNISNLQNYPSFTTWKTEYDKWYVKQDRDDQMIELVNSSIGLIGDVANKVPLYGSIVQTVSSGIGTLISSFGNKHKELKKKTPEMLRLLNATSQFENQKAIIDHEWEQINKELSQLQAENDKLLREQLKYYGIDYNQYESEYLNATLETERDRFKTKCRTTLNTKITAFDKDTVTANKWLGQVETYMYKVQSLRIRFGNLTNRMLSNIDRYEQLIKIYSDKTKFPQELTDKIEGLGKTLSSVKKNFSTTFKPEKYIEDSAVMYIEKSE
jgi:hypothetical protein